mmetsp:Transcript_32707/g.75273  ORF Transcript_32707/g.75273 Transcript_32707/m.75273 type:complete len:228 (+) Transcript_32707:400-1083(+)
MASTASYTLSRRANSRGSSMKTCPHRFITYEYAISASESQNPNDPPAPGVPKEEDPGAARNLFPPSLTAAGVPRSSGGGGRSIPPPMHDSKPRISSTQPLSRDGRAGRDRFARRTVRSSRSGFALWTPSCMARSKAVYIVATALAVATPLAAGISHSSTSFRSKSMTEGIALSCGLRNARPMYDPGRVSSFHMNPSGRAPVGHRPSSPRIPSSRATRDDGTADGRPM